MKTILLNRKLTRCIKLITAAYLLFNSSHIFSQVQNNSNIHIHDGANVYLISGSYNFGVGSSSTKTSRTTNIYGKLSFAPIATWNNATNSHFLDGYARTYSNASVILPIGQSNILAPIGLMSSNNAGVDAAYYLQNPNTVGATLDTNLFALSMIEYWNVIGNNNTSKIALTWRNNSDIASLTSNLSSNLANLTVAGWDGAKWVSIPSTYDPTSILGTSSILSSGSISTTATVDLSTYNYFTIALKDSCAPLIGSSGITKTWNGSWLPSAPTLADPVIINAPYSGNLQCNSLVLNSNITLSNNQNVEIVYGASGTGKIIMSSEASLVQRDQTSTAPNIELTKTTRPMRRFDYVYWGTPIAGNFFSQLSGATAQGQTTANAFDLKYKYVSGPPPGNSWQTLDAITIGKGFITRVKEQAPFTNDTNSEKIDMLFNGVANNGDVTVSVVNNPNCLSCGSSHNLLANPYPSAIDAVKFLRKNTSIDGAIYLWTSNSLNSNGTSLYTQSDYAVWNLAGTVNTSPISQAIDGRIASGQGFKVKALANGNVTFTNCMRLSSSNNNFFRKSEDLPTIVNRFKLTMTTAKDVFSQILIAYTPEATYEYDRLFDAGRNSVSTAQLYSIFEGDGRKLSINGRPEFDVTDVVPLGVSKSTTDNEDFTLTLQSEEGIFADKSVAIYLHDKEKNIYHDLALANYKFNSNTTTLNNRFEIVYQYKSLGNSDFLNFTAFANIKNKQFIANAKNEMEEIVLFDITGKEIARYKNVNEKVFSTSFLHAQGIYIAKIKLDSGETINQKLINID